MITHLSVMQLRQVADLKERIEALHNELERILGVPARPAAEAPKAPAAVGLKKKNRVSAQGIANIRAGVARRMAKKLTKAAGEPVTSVVKPVAASGGKPGMSMKAAILKVLASGKEMNKKALASRVAVFRGKTTNAGTFSPLLRAMKSKDKTITNPSRGFWKLR